MTTEIFANAAVTSVGSGDIDASSTSLPVTSSASPFPQTGNFRILVDSEIMLVTAVPDGTHFTVTRGVEGSTAAGHTAGASVTHVVTSGSIAQFRSDTLMSGAAASRPTAGVTGRIYLTTDAPYIYRDNGSTWNAWLSWPLNPPDPAWTGYGWTNQGSATITANVNGVTTLYDPPHGTDNFRIWSKNVPATPYTYTIGVMAPIFANNWNSRCGMLLHDATKAVDLAMYGANNSPIIVVSKWNSFTSYNSDYSLLTGSNVLGPAICGPLLFMRINDDGINRNCYISMDNISYLRILSTTNTDWVTPTKIGFYVNANNANGNGIALGLDVFHLVG